MDEEEEEKVEEKEEKKEKEVSLRKTCLFPDAAFSGKLVRLSPKGEKAGQYILSGERVRAGGPIGTRQVHSEGRKASGVFRGNRNQR